MEACTECRVKAGQRDGLCAPCRVRRLGLESRRYRFSDELRRELTEAYRQRKPAMSRAIGRMAARTGWPRHAFQAEAERLGLTSHWRPWAPEEDTYLRAAAGRVSVDGMARKLERRKSAVIARLDALKVSRRPVDGYTAQALAATFGVTTERVERWMRRGLLGKVRDWGGRRVSDEDVARFIRQCPHEYDLRRVDQLWFKSMVFGEEVA